MGIEEIIYVISTLLVIVGALNWGAYALGHNLVEKIGNKNVQNAIYYLIAISGVVSLFFFKNIIFFFFLYTFYIYIKYYNA